MTAAVFDIRGGDYAAGGGGSRRLKALLQEVGVDPKTTRRAMVAAYEAEMNAVIHGGDAQMRVALDPHLLEVTVTDAGPGIADVPAALCEGFSTAPAAARELGFGAGMGLPNIRKNTDRFTIRSAPGRGTQLRFAVLLAATPGLAEAGPVPHLTPADCVTCGRCVRACPTGALRLYGDALHLRAEQCIGCNVCASVCPERVFHPFDPADAAPVGGTLLLPTSALGQAPGMTAEALAALPAAAVRAMSAWEQAMAQAVRTFAETAPTQPVIAPVCPAAVALIRLRFPALLIHVAPLVTPLEAALDTPEEAVVAAVPMCPAQAALAVSGPMTRVARVTMDTLCVALTEIRRAAAHEHPPYVPGPAEGGALLEISGPEQVMRFLERLEAGAPTVRGPVALYLCPGGCYGAPGWPEVAAIARQRAAVIAPAFDTASHAVHRTAPLTPRAGERLDDDMAAAIDKLGRIDTLVTQLPGRDCAACGAPNCAAFATDVVQGRAALGACPYCGKTPAPTRRREEDGD
ncbi:MAG: (Fe-S)-binding protein [Candidatus Hydrogenedentota bacterium]